MLDPDLLCGNLEAVATCLLKRGFILDCDNFEVLYNKRRSIIQEVEKQEDLQLGQEKL